MGIVPYVLMADINVLRRYQPQRLQDFQPQPIFQRLQDLQPPVLIPVKNIIVPPTILTKPVIHVPDSIRSVVKRVQLSQPRFQHQRDQLIVYL